MGRVRRQDRKLGKPWSGAATGVSLRSLTKGKLVLNKFLVGALPTRPYSRNWRYYPVDS